MTIAPRDFAESTPTTEQIRIHSDNAVLVGTLHRPSGLPKAAIVFHGATAVPQSYYSPFAKWLTAQGFLVLTYDYRDFGASKTKSARDSQATLVDWGLRDQAAATAALLTRLHPDVPIWAIGHSLGGLFLPFHENAARLSRIITVASGPVHFQDHPWWYKPAAGFFWYGGPRWITAALGYMPGWAMGQRHDLPRHVYRQWRRFCTTPGFHFGEIGHSLPVPDWRRMRGKAKIVAVADDAMVPPQAVWRTMQLYPEAAITQLTLRPQAYGLPRIGHIGPFARANQALWPDLIA